MLWRECKVVTEDGVDDELRANSEWEWSSLAAGQKRRGLPAGLAISIAFHPLKVYHLQSPPETGAKQCSAKPSAILRS